jgi:hypothetical protein
MAVEVTGSMTPSGPAGSSWGGRSSFSFKTSLHFASQVKVVYMSMVSARGLWVMVTRISLRLGSAA